MKTIRFGIAALGLGLGMVWMSGCSSADSPKDERVESGSLEMQLTGSANGNTYQLRNATFDISGASSTSVSSETNPNAPTIDVVLPTGDYSVLLQSGWTLQRMDATGPVAVQASLVSPNPAGTTIFDGATSTVVFAFETDGTIVTIGNGTLSIGIQVADTSATTACDPLDQSTCAAGEACYLIGPDEGTCAAEGTLSEGQTCGFVNECSAGMTCADLGAGPVCTTVCDLSAPSCSTCADVGGGGAGLCVDPSTTPSGCSYAGQDCASGEGCYPQQDPSTGEITGVCAPAGTSPPGASCDPAFLDSCVAGSMCVDFEGDGTGQCYETCLTDGTACASGGICSAISNVPGLNLCL